MCVIIIFYLFQNTSTINVCQPKGSAYEYVVKKLLPFKSWRPKGIQYLPLIFLPKTLPAFVTFTPVVITANIISDTLIFSQIFFSQHDVKCRNKTTISLVF